jgi:catechol 2,3-dioxygenase-like lactoylglutathione lyase family enzyme
MENQKRMRCDHIGLVTGNTEKMIRFYVERLGFELEKDEILPSSIAQELFGIASDFRFVRMVLDDVKVELFECDETEERREEALREGYHHWGLITSDREDYYQRLKRVGVDVIELERDDGSKVYFARDPDGNLVEIR